MEKTTKKSSRRNHTFSLRKKDSPELYEFIDMQDNFNDSIRVLIYQEIKRSGGARNISKDLGELYGV